MHAISVLTIDVLGELEMQQKSFNPCIPKSISKKKSTVDYWHRSLTLGPGAPGSPDKPGSPLSPWAVSEESDAINTGSTLVKPQYWYYCFFKDLPCYLLDQVPLLVLVVHLHPAQPRKDSMTDCQKLIH